MVTSGPVEGLRKAFGALSAGRRCIEQEIITMRVLRLAAMIFAIVGGYLALPGPASAAPLGAGALPFVQTEAPLVAKAQWGYRRGYGYGRGYGYRRGWGGY